jgi:hypothetical protein
MIATGMIFNKPSYSQDAFTIHHDVFLLKMKLLVGIQADT